jgi:steroid delta-isomerase-like uncharacterized protein
MRRIYICTVLLGLLLAGPLDLAAGSCGDEKNKAVARQLFEVALNQGNWDVYNEIHTKDFVAHAGKRSASLGEDLEDAKGWRLAFPDGRYTVDQVLAEGDFVVVRFTGRGANTGAGNGLPVTGKQVELSGITIFRIVGGKIAEEWTEYNKLSLLKQLGLAPSGAQ